MMFTVRLPRKRWLIADVLDRLNGKGGIELICEAIYDACPELPRGRAEKFFYQVQYHMSTDTDRTRREFKKQRAEMRDIMKEGEYPECGFAA
jgi:hypothetical protein